MPINAKVRRDDNRAVLTAGSKAPETVTHPQEQVGIPNPALPCVRLLATPSTEAETGIKNIKVTVLIEVMYSHYIVSKIGVDINDLRLGVPFE